MTLADGEVLTLGFARGGSFSYLAIEGGIPGEPMFGSLAVNARAGLGSPYPRPLQAGDELQVAAAAARPSAGSIFPPPVDSADPRGDGSAGRRIRRRREKAVSGQRVEDIGDQRPHGLSARRSRRSGICTATTSSPTAP
jgi:allophanate hydrolase subunit 2